MEIYYNTADFITHVVYYGNSEYEPDDVTFEVRGSDDSVIHQGAADPTENPGEYIAHLPPFSDYDTKTIRWSYTLPTGAITTEPDTIHTVRPYITPSAYNAQALPGEKLNPVEFRQLEAVVRNVIDSYCRQHFQTHRATKTVPGSSTNSLQLPERLVRLHSIWAVDEPIALLEGYEGIYGDDSYYERKRAQQLSPYTLDNYVSFNPSNPWEVRRSVSAESPGANPVRRYQFFKSGRLYAIDGDWGWELVPQPVQQAASILVSDYLDDDSKWREKYVGVARAADWRMEFFATGNETTGNANADMILERYRSYRPEVV